MPTESLSQSEAVRHRIEEYRTTVHALFCLLGVLTWNDEARAKHDDAHFSLGRRMNTSPANSISPSNTVTPDAVAQRGLLNGFIVEAKKSLPRNTELWETEAAQIKKYDDDLTGWWTSDATLQSHSIILLLEIARSADFRNYLATLIADGQLHFDKPLSLVEFTPSPNGKLFLFLRKLWGSIADPDLSAQLESGTKVPLEEVLRDNGNKKYYDARPITEYTMEILWQHVFNPMKDTVTYDHALKAWPLHVTVHQTTREVQRLYGSEGNEAREVEYPKLDWVKEALDAFVSIGLAKPGGGSSSYIVHFKRIKGDLIEKFTLHRSPGAVEPDAPQPTQLPLI